MAYQVLYRTYRPKRFDEVVGQKYIIKTLLNAIKTKKIAHAYLFAGPRGTGKTTVAKLFAKAINCENFDNESCDSCDSCKAYLDNNHPDIIELDAASNNGVEEIRDIIERVPYLPLVGKYKIYIIDEVHMLTTNAFNALLKTLEEPPAHVIFILATTDPQKIIPTVLSRLQRYNFSKLTTFEIKKRMIEILEKENIKYEEKAIEEIARMADGGVRDGLSILEQCLSYNSEEIKLEDIEHIFGLLSTNKQIELLLQIHKGKINNTISSLRKMYQGGIDLKRLALDLIEILKDVLIYSDEANSKLLTKLNASEVATLLNEIDNKVILNDLSELENLISKEKQNQNFLSYFEITLIRMCSLKNKEENKEITKAVEIKKEAPEANKIKEEAEIKSEEVPTKQEENNLIEISDEKILKILFGSSRESKINDLIIYNKLNLYKFEAEKRKYYQLLYGTELITSNKDAIIIVGNESQVNNINYLKNNRDLYYFLNNEFGIDKMPIALSEKRYKKIVEDYKKTPIELRNPDVYIEKYHDEEKKEKTKEEKLLDIFGEDLKIED